MDIDGILFWATDLQGLWEWWFSSTLKSLALLGLAWLIDRAWRRTASADLRHRFAMAAALGVPVIFFLNLSAVPERTGWKPLHHFREPVERSSVTREPAPPAVAPDAASRVLTPEFRQPREESIGLFPWWQSGILFSWSLGIACGGLVLLRRLRLPPDLAATATAPSQGRLADLFDREAAALGEKRRPRLRILPPRSASGPVTFGWRRTCVALPADAASWEESKLRTPDFEGISK